MMRVVRRLLLAGGVALLLGVSAALLVFGRSPLVSAPGAVSVDDVQRARRLLARNDPRRIPEAVPSLVVLTQQDVTLLTQYAASRWRRAATRVTLRDGAADLAASIDVQGVPFGRWLNIRATVRDADGLPHVERLRVGALPVPSFAVQPVVAFVLARLGSDVPLALATEMVRGTVFTPTAVQIDYTWQKDAATRVRDMLMPPEDLRRLELAHEDLAQLLRTAPAEVPLHRLLVPMLQSATTRALAGDAVAEHRAVLLTLTLYATRRPLGRWVRRAAAWSPLPPRRVTLAGRDDLAKHFLVSAVVSSQNGGALSDAVGQTKELDDSRGGTGFSFVDIAADRAGTLFGEVATRSPQRIHDAVAAGLVEADIIPSVEGLPERMAEAEFVARFGGIGAPAYQAMMQRIESRLDALPLYRR